MDNPAPRQETGFQTQFRERRHTGRIHW